MRKLGLFGKLRFVGVGDHEDIKINSAFLDEAIEEFIDTRGLSYDNLYAVITIELSNDSSLIEGIKCTNA